MQLISEAPSQPKTPAAEPPDFFLREGGAPLLHSVPTGTARPAPKRARLWPTWAAYQPRHLTPAANTGLWPAGTQTCRAHGPITTADPATQVSCTGGSTQHKDTQPQSLQSSFPGGFGDGNHQSPPPVGSQHQDTHLRTPRGCSQLLPSGRLHFRSS
ncbi:hypothetical protein NDU88_004872 [Pleurodeles waltl]|uniref:Uncharacterized protein n=1 Tax=Pleurodeles waltl TaxID=8319 RepID=A0AAV7TT73_PLEWA|nr:hypothetical protein NDU88_004872 [Pleurodeles waltl]